MSTKSIVGASAEPDRLLDSAEVARIVSTIKRDASSEGMLKIFITSTWSGSVRWARNRPFVTRNGRDTVIFIERRLSADFGAPSVYNYCNQTDDASLRTVVQYIEYFLQRRARSLANGYAHILRPEWEKNAGGPVWSDTTFNPDLQYERTVLSTAIDRSEQEQLLAAGYLESYAASGSVFKRDYWGRESLVDCGRFTQAQLSMTARSNDALASGWAGRSSHGLERLPLEKICSLAIEKCLASRAPVRLEPGRYTTILEPQAAHALFVPLVRAMERLQPEGGFGGPFQLEYDPAIERVRTRLGLKVLDERISIFHDPEDPNTATLRNPGASRVQWVKNGVLVGLVNRTDHEHSEMSDGNVFLERLSFNVEGTSTTREELIASTRRGLIVTRFSNVEPVDLSSLLMSGFTRDGLWLIENGKITRAVKNFRFTESPLFAFNNVEQIGVAEPVWNPRQGYMEITGLQIQTLASAMVPSIKVKDFSFTATIDAI